MIVLTADGKTPAVREVLSELATLERFAGIYKEHASGMFTFENEQGIVVAQGAYKDGRAVGVWKHYYDCGVLKSVYDFDNRTTTLYLMTGKIKSRTTDRTGNYCCEKFSPEKNGVLVWKQEIISSGTGSARKVYNFYGDGKVKSIHTYLNDSPFIDLEEDFDEHGKLLARNEFTLGKKFVNNTSSYK